MTSSLKRRDFLRSSASVAAFSAVAFPSLSSSSMSFEEYRSHDALGLADLVRKGEVSAQELLTVAIDAAAKINPAVNCIVENLNDRAMASINNKVPQGVFGGVPFLLKDLGTALEGTVTTNGSRFYQNAKMDYTSTVVKRHQQAGLVVFGKTASPEFGGTGTTESTLFGDTRNPWDLSKTSGGSSGGASAAVAAGILPMAHATDGGGSIRIPASCCGLFGLKPSRGRTPHGPKALSATLSVTHAVSRSVRDSAVLLDVTAGAEAGQTLIAPPSQKTFFSATQTAPKRLRIGLIAEAVTRSQVHPECVKAADNAARLCESLGHHVERIKLPVDPQFFFAAYGPVSAASLVSRVQLREKQLGRRVTEADLEPITWLRYQQAKDTSAAQLFEAQKNLEVIARDMALMQETVDVLLSPTLASPPVDLGVLSLDQPNGAYQQAATDVAAFTMLYNGTGQPAMSVPLHWTDSNLPVGVMFAGRYGEEYTLLQLAAQLEQAQPWFDRVPAAIG